MSWSPPGDTGQTLIPGLNGYTDLQLIAHGSTAMVFRATQIRLNRTVAIKVLLVDDVMTTAANVARELETTVALSSQPHIVSIIDTGVTDDSSPFIVMEYCEGGSYAQILKRRGPLPVDEVLDVGVKIGEALHAAHEVGIIHRDVKPPNILRSRFGPALTDFGIARAADDGGVATSTLDKLTPQHASPEAMLRDPQSGLSDLYSLASTMWNLLAGRAPFTDPNQPYFDPMSFRERVLTDPVPRVPRDDLPEWLQHELAKAMEKNPNDRHASAGAFAETLRLHGSRTALAPWPQQPAQPVQEPVSSVDADVPTQTTGDSMPPASGAGAGAGSAVGAGAGPAAGVGGPAPSGPPAAAAPPATAVPPGPQPVVWPTSGPVRISRPEVEEPDVHSPATELVAPPTSPPAATAPPATAWPPQSAEPPAPFNAPLPVSAPPHSAPPAAGPQYASPPVSAPPAVSPQSAPPAPHSAPPAQHSAPPGPGFDLTAELTYLPEQPAPPASAPPAAAHPASAPPAPTPWPPPAQQPPPGWAATSFPPPPPAPTSAPPVSAPPGWPPRNDQASAPPALFPQPTDYSTPAPTPASAGPTSWPQPTRRAYLKPLLIAVAIGTVLGLTALLGLLIVQGKDDPGTDQRADPTPTPSASASGGITLTKEGAPSNLVVDDRGTSVILNWIDNTGGRAPFIIFSARTGQQTKAVGRELQGETSHVVDGLNPKADYCFVVTAAVSVEVLANSDSVCTRRLGANASEPAATPS